MLVHGDLVVTMTGHRDPPSLLRYGVVGRVTLYLLQGATYAYIMDTFWIMLGVAWGCTLELVGMTSRAAGVTAVAQLAHGHVDAWVKRMVSRIKEDSYRKGSARG